jgi:exodeoxyribonuclease VII small subunit
MSELTEPPATFEDALAELEAILRQLEDGTTGLEDSLACYERGVGLLKRCYGQLKDAEQRILLLTGVDDEGRPLTQPFEHAPTAETDGKRRR